MPDLPSFPAFSVDIDEGVATLWLNRASAFNAMTPDFWNDLPQIVEALDRTSDVRALVVAARGKHFSSGMDFDAFASMKTGLQDVESGRWRANFRRNLKRLQTSFSALEETRLPVVAAIQGGCVGGAVDLVAACDIRLCAEGSFLVIQETNVGMTADVGTFPRMRGLLPEGVLRDIAMTGRKMHSAEMDRWGFAREVPGEVSDLHAAALETAKSIANKSPLTLQGVKRMLNYSRDHSVDDTLDYIATWQSGMFSFSDIDQSVARKDADGGVKYQDHYETSDIFGRE